MEDLDLERGERIRLHRATLNMSQAEPAQAAGIAPADIGRIEAGHDAHSNEQAHYSIVGAIAGALKTNALWLVTGMGDSEDRGITVRTAARTH